MEQLEELIIGQIKFEDGLTLFLITFLKLFNLCYHVSR